MRSSLSKCRSRWRRFCLDSCSQRGIICLCPRVEYVDDNFARVQIALLAFANNVGVLLVMLLHKHQSVSFLHLQNQLFLLQFVHCFFQTRGARLSVHAWGQMMVNVQESEYTPGNACLAASFLRNSRFSTPVHLNPLDFPKKSTQVLGSCTIDYLSVRSVQAKTIGLNMHFPGRLCPLWR